MKLQVQHMYTNGNLQPLNRYHDHIGGGYYPLCYTVTLKKGYARNVCLKKHWHQKLEKNFIVAFQFSVRLWAALMNLQRTKTVLSTDWVYLRNGSCLLCDYHVMDTHEQLWEHERSIWVAQGKAVNCALFLIYSEILLWMTREI